MMRILTEIHEKIFHESLIQKNHHFFLLHIINFKMFWQIIQFDVIQSKYIES